MDMKNSRGKGCELRQKRINLVVSVCDLDIAPFAELGHGDFLPCRHDADGQADPAEEVADLRVEGWHPAGRRYAG